MALIRGYVVVSMSMVIMAIMWTHHQAEAQSSSCTSAITSLSPCLNYIMGTSSTPSSSCCSQLSSVVKNEPQCLCSLLNGGGSSFGITINQTLALSLPSACKVKTPPVSQCKGVNGPISPSESPAGSPADSPDGSITPSASDSPSVSGSKRVPSTAGASSGGSNIKVPSQFVLSLVVIVSFVSTFTKLF